MRTHSPQIRGLLCAALLVLGGCRKGDGIMLVSVTAGSGAPVNGVTRLQVTATLDSQTRMFSVPPTDGAPFDLPPAKTFGIDIPRALTGKLQLSIVAYAGKTVVGSGQNSMTVATGARADVSVMLAPTMTTAPGDGGADMTGVDLGPVVAPRLIAPLSTAKVTRRRPTLRWQLPGSGTPTVELCQDRACTFPLAITVTIGADNQSAVPTADLPTGTVFWRVHAVGGGSDMASPTWQLFVGATIATVAADTSNTAQLDVNGDGYADLAIAAPMGSGNTVGKVHIFLGGPTGVNSPGATSQEIDAPDASNVSFGFQVAAAGDINGDGFGDVAISNVSGSVSIYFGSINGVHPSVASAVQTITTPSSAGTMSDFGELIGCAGDINGDGYADLFVAANSATVGGTDDVGSVYVFLGSATGVNPTDPSRVIVVSGVDVADSEFGDGVGAADVNGDGYGDLIVGTEFGGSAMEGRLLVYYGGSDGLQPNVDSRVSNVLGPEPGESYFGAAISTTDLNGDGYSDILVSAWGYNAQSGRVYIYLGSASGITPAVASSVITIDSPDGANASYGIVLSGAGDLDNDGFGDLIVGEQLSGANPGKVFVYYGAATGGYRMPGLAIPGALGDSAGFGRPVIGVGDSNGDGYSEVAVGASGGNGGVGVVYVYLGGAGGLQPTAAGHFVTIGGPDGTNAGFGSVLGWRQPLPKPGRHHPAPRNIRRHA